MRERVLHILPWVVFVVALFLLVTHVVGWEKTTVDTTTLILIAILLVTPFVEHVRRIRIGELEAEIAPREVQRVRSDVERRLGEELPPLEAGPVVQSRRQELLDQLETDHVLALAKLRISIERALTRLHRLSTREPKKRKALGLSRLVGELVAAGVLPRQLSEPLREVVFLCNRAVHGESVRYDDAREIVRVGIRILESIEDVVEEYAIRPTKEEPITSEEVRNYIHAMYRVTTVIPYVENPVRNIRTLDQEGLDAFLEGYNEYAEFLVGIEKLDN